MAHYPQIEVEVYQGTYDDVKEWHPKDRRQLTIRLTETGRENARIDQAARIRFREQAFSALTHDEREQLAEMLEKIRKTWEELDD